MEEKQSLSTSNKAMDIQFENVWLTVRQGKGKFSFKLKNQIYCQNKVTSNDFN